MKIIIQAGGKGSRMGKYTENIPKPLVDIYGKPILFYMLDAFKNYDIYVITNYKSHLIKLFIEIFYKNRYNIHIIQNDIKGTSSGIEEVINTIDDKESIMIMWSDLFIYNQDVLINKIKNLSKNKNYIGISSTFKCRWSYEHNMLQEKESDVNGIAGVFIIKNKNVISDIKDNKEFVRYLQNKDINFIPINISDCIDEVGTKEKYESKYLKFINRSFNKITINNNIVIKTNTNDTGKKMINNEIKWYNYVVMKKGFNKTPIIDIDNKKNKIIMNYIQKKNYYTELNKQDIINIINIFHQLHNIEQYPKNYNDFYEEYINKTFTRINRVKKLLPLDSEYIVVNNKKLHNFNFYKSKIFNIINDIYVHIDKFYLGHGDLTLQNTLIDKDSNIYIIDPRGHFGDTTFFVDKMYDYAKMLYSLYGYDILNEKKFRININYDIINYEMNEIDIFLKYINLYIHMVYIKEFKYLYNDFNLFKKHIKFVVALIFLSFTGYTYSYDQMNLAYVRGIELLNGVI